jgi:hypothetical protein
MNQPTVPDDEVTAVAEALAGALQLLATQDDVPPPLLDTVWARIGDAAATAALAESLDESNAKILRTTLLACASGNAPRLAESAEASFNIPAWSPAARNAAAQGIPRLLRHRTDTELATKLRALATDPVPSVRYLLASELQRLIPRHEDSFWALAGLYAAEENNGLVLQALGGALMQVATADREKLVTGTLDQLLRRLPLAELGRSVPNEDRISALIVGLAIARNNEWARKQIDDAVRDAPPRFLSTLVLHLLHYVNYSRIPDPNGRVAAEFALGWLPQIIGRVHHALRDEAERDGQDGRSGREDAIRELFSVLDHIITRFYFQSGVYKGQGGQRAGQEEICSFFAMIRPHLRQLGEVAGGGNGFGLPARTAHHLVELLRGSVGCDPAEVLHLTRLAVDGARGSGYAFDGMAAREVTAIAETLLADHRESAASGQPLDDLVHVLNAFVQAGWPEAQRLVWRLEELFR